MSLRSVRSRQESCTYRLNRAALMRMEEGRRKAWTKEEGYYGDRPLCIKVGTSKRYPWVDASRSRSQSDNEASRTEDDSVLSQERSKLRTIVKHQRRRNRDNASINSSKLVTSKKLRPVHKRKASTTSYRANAVEQYARTSIDVPHHKRKNKRLQTTLPTVVQRPTSAVKSQDKLQQLRPKTSTSSYSSDQPFQGRTSPQLKSERINKSENITWTSSPLTSYLVTPNRKRDYEEDITPKTTLLGTIRMDPTVAAETEPEPKPKPMSAKRNENPISQTNPKNSFGESLLTKQQKKNDKLLYDQSKEVLGESSIEAMMESLESVKKKERRRSARSSSIKRSGVRMSPGTKRLYFKPLTSAATVSSDQEEVISKWRKRLGTNSPPRPGHRGPSTPIIASSHLRNSQVLRVQGTSDDSYLNLGSTNFLIPEKDSAEMSLEEVELKKLLKPMTGKHPNEVFSANEEKEIFLRIEMEKTKKQIQFLEELARVKIQKLEAIQWKKKRALEEEAALNEKLEKLLWKIQQLRESDSFAELLDKQTQVFATKRLRPNIN